MSLLRTARVLLGAGLCAGLGTSLLVGCSPETITGDDEESLPVRLTTNVKQGADALDVSTLVSVTAFHGPSEPLVSSIVLESTMSEPLPPAMKSRPSPAQIMGTTGVCG
ncbi:MAG: hypothetical protein EON52_08140 [Actinomycetales bacterium]|nr:MAG: hypothetical protein EON52_08140 [Actinomycetales bacterium]